MVKMIGDFPDHAGGPILEPRPGGITRYEDGWQPIETAPKDRRFLGYRGPDPHEFDWYRISVCKFHKSTGGKLLLYSEADYEGIPWHDWTHWMPLPEPPKC